MKAVRMAKYSILFALLPVLFSAVFLFAYTAMRPTMSKLPPGPYPGDDVIEDAVMVYDHTRFINASPDSVWPWVLQVGKGRGGWYTPSSWERLLPRSCLSSKTINPQWQTLRVGDRVDDYGFGPDDCFIVAAIQPNRALVYKSDRYGAHFSWSDGRAAGLDIC